MVLSKRVGEILKEARQARKLSVRDVAKETNIAAKYVEALEAEDFSQFPGDTYAMGFLRNYVEFLNMDTEEILNLYRGQQIDQSPTPVEELTQMSSRPSFDFSRLAALWDGRYLIPVAGLGLLVLVVFLFLSGIIPMPKFSSAQSVEEVAESPCKNRELQDFTLPASGMTKGIFLDDKSSLRFSADQHSIKLCLIKVERDPAQGAIAHFSLFIDDEKSHPFSVKEREEYIVSKRIEGLEDLARTISLRPTALADYTAQIEFHTEAAQLTTTANPAKESTESATPADSTPPAQNHSSGTGLIQVTLEFVRPSYVQWVKDGQYFSGKTWPAGKTMTLEAKNRLEIKIGNGAGVRIHRDGARPRLAGRPAQIVNLVYSLVPDPLDPTIKKIKESVR